MKCLFLLSFLALAAVNLTACQSYIYHPQTQQTQATLAKSEIYHNEHKSNSTLIVYYDNDKKDEVKSLVQNLNGEIIYEYNLMNGFAIKVIPSELENIKNKLEENKGVLMVNYDNIYELH